jgi:acetyltransferase-like isoleucine patch superfamily enzyme
LIKGKILKEKIKHFIKNNPLLEKYIRIFLNPKQINNNIPTKIIQGKNNHILVDKSALLANFTFNIIGNNNQIEIDEASVLNNVTFFIRGNNNKIKLDKRTRFNRGGSIWIEDYDCEVRIGENSTFEDVHIAATEPKSKIIIGKDCMFAYNIDLRTGDSHSIIDSMTNERINYAQDIVIGNHVWIASHVSILKGGCISNNSVVATRAVVTKSFNDENILIGGIPAKKIKQNINWDRQRIYKKS